MGHCAEHVPNRRSVEGIRSPLVQESLDYDQVKLSLFQRFRLTAEGYRERFRGSKPENEETAKQYAASLKGFFERWIELAAIKRTFEDLADLVVTEQFIANCHKKVAIFIRERECKTLSATTTAADNFMEAQNQPNLLRFREDSKAATASTTAQFSSNKEYTGATGNKCFLCGREGHRASDCRSRTKPLFCQKCRSNGHDAKSCSRRIPSSGQVSCLRVEPDRSEEPTLEPSTVPESTESHVISAMNEATRGSSTNINMPIVTGSLNGEVVRVLRDTGCNTVVVRKDLVPPQAYTGKQSTITLVNGSSFTLPEALVTISSPFFSGTIVAKCMDSPIYDVVLGNVVGVRDPNDPDPNWERADDPKTFNSPKTETVGVVKSCCRN